MAAAGAAGYGVGTLINKYLIEGTKAQDVIGHAIYSMVHPLQSKRPSRPGNGR